MLQEKLFLEIKSFDSDRESEEKRIYSFDVSIFEVYSNHIVFKNCINNNFLAEMDDLNILKRNKKSKNLNLYLKSELHIKDKKISDELSLYYEFNYTDSDLIIYDFIDYEDNESYQESLIERVDIFMKNKEFLKFYLENKIPPKHWFNLNEFEKECWLDVAYKVNFNQEVNKRMPPVSQIILDGNYIHSERDLYCSIGEEVCGVFGYMGRSITPLRDCLEDEGLRPVYYPLQITWKNFKSSEQNFYSIEDLNYLVQFLRKYSNLKIEI